jgi:molecular chaperone GrpE
VEPREVEAEGAEQEATRSALGPDGKAPVEPPPPGGGGGSPGAEADEAAAVEVEKDFDALLDETKRERDEYLELAQRTRADFENYRKRMAAETEAAATRGSTAVARELIEVVDNLERAIEAAGHDPAAVLESGIPEVEGALAQGCLLTYRDLRAGLGRAGVEVYAPVGETFDPSWHEALQTRAEEGAEAGRILEVMQKGYRIGDVVLRPARVVVSE